MKHRIKLSPYGHGGTKTEIDGVEWRGITNIEFSHAGGGIATLKLTICANLTDWDIDVDEAQLAIMREEVES